MISAFSGFSGAGAVLLGEWLGWHHAGACDREAFCRAVIKHRLPDVPTFDDMAAVPWESAWSDCSPADGPANLTASPASGSPTPTSETDGDLLSAPFAVVDPISRSWRTSQQSFLATPIDTGAPASPTWPASGTMRNGWCWERTMPAPTTAGDASGSSRGDATWPTPCATDAASAANRTAGRTDPDSNHHSGTTLTDAIRLFHDDSACPTSPTDPAISSSDGTEPLWPTPTAHGHARGAGNTFSDRHHKPHDLETAARQWPTPSASNPNDHESVESFEARRALVKAKHKNGNGMGTPLSIAARSWPTPTASDCVQSRDANKRGNLTLAGASSAWATPTASAPKSGGHYGSGGPTLSTQARNFDFTADDRRLRAISRVLNPCWVEAILGWPPGWTGLPAEAIAQLRREKRNASGKRRAPRPVSPVAPKRSARSAMAGTSPALPSLGTPSSAELGSTACSAPADP